MEGEASLEPADQDNASMRSRGYLPHWERGKAIYLVTFRLADALPRHVLQAYEAEREALLAKAQADGQAFSPAERERLDHLVSRRVQRYLDAGAGACYLASPAVAEIVARALCHFNGIRYQLFAWCIMPNHVHVVMQPLAPYALSGILHSWKSFAANEALRLLRVQGRFWQREYYDHLIRDEQALWRIVKYVAENPVKAHLRDWQWVDVCVPLEDAL